MARAGGIDDGIQCGAGTRIDEDAIFAVVKQCAFLGRNEWYSHVHTNEPTT